MGGEAPALSMQGVSKRFGDHLVLDSIDLAVARSETVAIIGPSGSGKSTVCRVLAGLEQPSGGTLHVHGVEWVSARENGLYRNTSYDKMRRSIGMVFQNYTLFPQLTVGENVALGPRKVLELRGPEVDIIVERVLARVGLSDKRSAYPATLSGGQQQRAAIARELAMQRDILLFDEATSALDPELVAEVLAVVRELNETGMTLVLVTHEMQFAADVADRIIFMADGRICEQGPAATFFSNPVNERTKTFLSRVSF